jgi:hypothetical protein
VDVVRNKASGKIFVVLDDDGGPDFLLVTPQGRVKRLDRHLFTAQGLEDFGRGEGVRMLTPAQREVYAAYDAADH